MNPKNRTDKALFPGYDPVTDGKRIETMYWVLFSIVEVFSKTKLKKTWNEEWEKGKGDIKRVTELAVVLNHKCWQWYDRGDEDMCEWYRDRYYQVKDWVYDCGKFDEAERRFFYNVID